MLLSSPVPSGVILAPPYSVILAERELFPSSCTTEPDLHRLSLLQPARCKDLAAARSPQGSTSPTPTADLLALENYTGENCCPLLPLLCPPPPTGHSSPFHLLSCAPSLHFVLLRMFLVPPGPQKSLEGLTLIYSCCFLGIDSAPTASPCPVPNTLVPPPTTV